MIPPIVPNDVASLATQQSNQTSPDNSAQVPETAAAPETFRPTAPAEESAAGNNEQGFGTATQRLETENRTPDTALTSSQQAVDTVRQLVTEMQNSPAAAIQAQGAGKPDAVAQMLAAA